MIQSVQGREIHGCSFPGGIYWYWGDREVARMDRDTGEIEWLEQVSHFPEDVQDAVRERKPKPDMKWEVSVKRVSISTTQGYICVLVNGEKVATYGDDYEIRDHEWVSKSDDARLKKCALFGFESFLKAQ